jgi:hypothetical protein
MRYFYMQTDLSQIKRMSKHILCRIICNLMLRVYIFQQQKQTGLYIYIYIYMNWKHMTRSLALTPFNPFQTKSTDWPLIN